MLIFDPYPNHISLIQTVLIKMLMQSTQWQFEIIITFLDSCYSLLQQEQRYGTSLWVN